MVGLALYLGYLFNSPPKVELKVYIQFLTFIVVAVALSVAVWVQFRKDSQGASEDYLNRAISLIEKAHEILSNEAGCAKHDRVSWVTAARLLQTAEVLEKKIKEESHLDIYASEKDYQRHRFHKLLAHQGKPLPAEYFLGGNIVYGDIGASAYSKTSGKVGGEWIPIKAVSVVYRFKTYPDNYIDPLGSAKDLSYKEIDKLDTFGQDGLIDYLKFRHHFLGSGDRVYSIRSSYDKSVSPTDINIKMNELRNNHDLSNL